MAELNSGGSLKFEVNGESVELGKEDLLIDTVKSEHYVSESNAKVSVVLDIFLTEELIEEGFVREVISKIQTMRKEAGFEVMDHIVISVSDNDKLIDIINNNKNTLKSETLADDVLYTHEGAYSKEWNLNGENVTLGVKKV